MAKSTSGAGKPRKSTTERTSAAKAGGIAKSGAGAARPVKGSGQASGHAASRLIDERIRELGGWRGETLARMRALILEADPGMTEEWK